MGRHGVRGIRLLYRITILVRFSLYPSPLQPLQILRNPSLLAFVPLVCEIGEVLIDWWSGQCVGKMRDGRSVVALNPVAKSWGPRTPLVCMISSDDGETWREWCVLENQPPPEGFDGVVALETGIVNDGQSEFS